MTSRIKTTFRRYIPLRALTYLMPKCVAILRYHSIHSDSVPLHTCIPPGISHDVDLFEKQVDMLSKKFNLVDMNQVAESIETGKSLPRHSVALTFDDGYKNNLLCAGPILERYNVRGTIYVLSENLIDGLVPWFCQTHDWFARTSLTSWTNPLFDTRMPLESAKDRSTERRNINSHLAGLNHITRIDLLESIRSRLEVSATEIDDIFLNKTDIQILLKKDQIIGSHTHSHPNLTRLSENDAKFEISHSMTSLENLLGIEIKHFSFPNPFHQPHWSRSLCDDIQKAGFSTAVTCEIGYISNLSNAHALARVPAPTSVAQLKWNLDRLFSRL